MRRSRLSPFPLILHGGVVCCVVVRYGVVQCGAVWCGVACRRVAWRGVVCYEGGVVVWCAVVYCAGGVVWSGGRVVEREGGRWVVVVGVMVVIAVVGWLMDWLAGRLVVSLLCVRGSCSTCKLRTWKGPQFPLLASSPVRSASACQLVLWGSAPSRLTPEM